MIFQLNVPFSSGRTAVLTQTELGRNPFFISSERSDFHMINNRSEAVHAFVRRMLKSLSADKILLPMYVFWLTNFRGMSLKLEMTLLYLKHKNSVSYTFTQRTIPTDVCSALCSRDSVWMQEVIDHLHCRQLSLFPKNFDCFFFIFLDTKQGFFY